MAACRRKLWSWLIQGVHPAVTSLCKIYKQTNSTFIIINYKIIETYSLFVFLSRRISFYLEVSFQRNYLPLCSKGNGVTLSLSQVFPKLPETQSWHFWQPVLSFLAELFCSLTGNILGLKSHGGRCADNVQMTCGWCVDDLRMTREWDFGRDLAGGWHMSSRTSSGHLPELPNFIQYYTWCHLHVIHSQRN